MFQPQQSEQVSIEMTKQILEKLFDVLQEIQKNIPYTHDPPNLKTRLLPYQRQGLGWLRKREVLPAISVLFLHSLSFISISFLGP